MKVLSKDMFMPCENGRPVVGGFVTYISSDKPILIHRSGRADYSDAYDDYADIISCDNGSTWSEPVMRLQAYDVPGGRMRYGEPTALFDPDTAKLIVITNRVLYPNDELDVDIKYAPLLGTFDPTANQWSDLTAIEFDYPGSLAVSFCFPIKTTDDHLVFPVQSHFLDDNGNALHYQGCWSPAGVVLFLLGEYRPDGSIAWKLSGPIIPDLEKTSRGFYEPTIAELRDGRFAAIMRGDNSMFPEKPGYKWLSFSDDHCQSWSEAIPLPCDKGDPIESGSNGSALFRSIKTDKLYWMGNLCIDGVRPNGNWPRTPIVIAQVQEEPFALKRDTITVIDRQAPGEPPQVQMSNFRFYQDRSTGDVVLFLSRYGERSAEQWMLADYYRYRIAID